MKLYFRLLKSMHPYWLSFLFALFCIVVFALSTGAMAYLIGPAIKMLFAAEANETTRFIPLDLLTIDQDKKILAIPIALVVVAVIKGLSFYGNTYYMGYGGNGPEEETLRAHPEASGRLFQLQPHRNFDLTPYKRRNPAPEDDLEHAGSSPEADPHDSSACRRDSEHGLEARPYLGRSLPLGRMAHDKVRGG
jgi:ABC-type multidrug transport system fused ATPase/permease subunit